MTRCLALILAAVAFSPAQAAEVSPLPDGLYAEFTTPRGTVTCELFYQRAPLMCVNFTGLAAGQSATFNPVTGF